MWLFRLSWSASLKAEFEHVQLWAEYAWLEKVSRSFLNEFKLFINWQSAMLTCYSRGSRNPETQGEFNWQQKI